MPRYGDSEALAQAYYKRRKKTIDPTSTKCNSRCVDKNPNTCPVDGRLLDTRPKANDYFYRIPCNVPGKQYDSKIPKTYSFFIAYAPSTTSDVRVSSDEETPNPVWRPECID